jgi:hypothetical protein
MIMRASFGSEMQQALVRVASGFECLQTLISGLPPPLPTARAAPYAL